MNNKKGRTRFYSIHDILNFAVIDNSRFRLFDTFYNHYINFQKDDLNLEYCDLIIELGNFDPNLDGSYIVGDGKYFFQKDYMYVPKEQYKGAKWRFEIQGLNGGQTIARIDFNSLGRIFVTGNVIDFLIHLKLLEKNCPILHASAIDNNNTGYIFSSRGGAGKTTTALNMLDKGFNLIGDNYIIVSQNKIMSFPTSLSIFTYNLAPIIRNNLGFKDKLSLNVKTLLYNMTRGYAKFFTKINPKILNKYKNSSKFHMALILVPNINGKLFAGELDIHKFSKYIRYNQMLEFSFFNNYIEEYSYIFPRENFSFHWDTYEKSVLENCKDTIRRLIYLPQRLDKNSFDYINSIIKFDNGVNKEMKG